MSFGPKRLPPQRTHQNRQPALTARAGSGELHRDDSRSGRSSDPVPEPNTHHAASSPSLLGTVLALSSKEHNVVRQGSEDRVTNPYIRAGWAAVRRRAASGVRSPSLIELPGVMGLAPSETKAHEEPFHDPMTRPAPLAFNDRGHPLPAAETHPLANSTDDQAKQRHEARQGRTNILFSKETVFETSDGSVMFGDGRETREDAFIRAMTQFYDRFDSGVVSAAAPHSYTGRDDLHVTSRRRAPTPAATGRDVDAGSHLGNSLSVAERAGVLSEGNQSPAAAAQLHAPTCNPRRNGTQHAHTFTCAACGAKGLSGHVCKSCGRPLPQARTCPSCRSTVRGHYCNVCGCHLGQPP